ncbi:MAG: hypothetical protein APF76_16570 [Desulfitibacter sp. BRH_c19]|nr:MAG: hypothetical protein APF76_16570 [Desulfitibacter sp. BRH_c19]
MALPPSGSKVQELLVITTEDFNLTIKGVPSNKTVEGFKLHLDNSGIPIKANLEISPGHNSVKVYDPYSSTGLSEYDGGKISPCFFERTNYEIILERKEGCKKKITIDHLNRKLREAITPTGTSGSILSGIVNFNDEVGFSRFDVLGDVYILLSFEIEVFPSKLDYRKDFWILLQEVNEEIYNLAFDFLMKTSFAASIRSSRDDPSQAEFYYIISSIFDKLHNSLNRVCNQPHHKIVRVNNIVSPEKVKKTDTKTLSWISRRAHLLQKSSTGIDINGTRYIPRKIINGRKELTYDTYENRFLKWIIKKIDSKLHAFLQKYEGISDKNLEGKVINSCRLMRKRLRAFYNNSFLKDVGDLSQIEQFSLVMQNAPGYKDVYKYYLMLSKGLNIKSDLFDLSIKNLAELYEYWCFLKLNSLLRKRYIMEKNSMLSIDRNGMVVTLAKGQKSELVYLNPKHNERIRVIYNKKFIDLPTIAQAPDNMLILEKSKSRTNFYYIFDAKYRISNDDQYIRTFNQPGPPEDAINSMHRYRDAIVSAVENKSDFQRNIFGAFILFPHNDELMFSGRKEKQANKFFESIEKVSIGALPFLPSQTTLVEEFLDELLLESHNTSFERSIVQEGAEEYSTTEANKRNVLIGPLGRKDQLQVCLDNDIYYTYLKEVQSILKDLEYVAIYQSKAKFKNSIEQGILHYGRIKNLDILRRSELIEMPARGKYDQLIVKFHVERWIKRDPRIIPAGYGPASPQCTSWSLFEEARVYPELHLANKAEIRLWRELKRFDERGKIKFPKQQIDSQDVIELLEFPGLVVERNKNDGFNININGKEKEYSFDTLNQRPGKIIKEILKMWYGDCG